MRTHPKFPTSDNFTLDEHPYNGMVTITDINTWETERYAYGYTLFEALRKWHDERNIVLEIPTTPNGFGYLYTGYGMLLYRADYDALAYVDYDYRELYDRFSDELNAATSDERIDAIVMAYFGMHPENTELHDEAYEE